MTREEARAIACVALERALKQRGGSQAEEDCIADAILAAVAEERARCAGIADAAARLATSGPPLVYITAQQFAADLAKDIADGVRQGLPAPERQPEPKLL
jgi:hypothetical protein